MVEVNVNDKLAPIVTSCPANATISCDDYLENYAAGVEQGDYSVLAWLSVSQAGTTTVIW
jgi:hypothetical protein